MPQKVSGLPKDPVVNITQIITVDKTFLSEFAGTLPQKYILKIEDGIRLALSL